MRRFPALLFSLVFTCGMLSTVAGVKWGQDEWHKVRLERDASKGTIKVFFDDMTEPIMLAEDKTFPDGLIDNIKIWGKKMSREKTDFFQKK